MMFSAARAMTGDGLAGGAGGACGGAAAERPSLQSTDITGRTQAGRPYLVVAAKSVPGDGLAR